MKEGLRTNLGCVAVVVFIVWFLGVFFLCPDPYQSDENAAKIFSSCLTNDILVFENELGVVVTNFGDGKIRLYRKQAGSIDGPHIVDAKHYRLAFSKIKYRVKYGTPQWQILARDFVTFSTLEKK